ncbi:MAG TPA: 5'-methylthioadenosine/S-adenosylhomocysteine nucleosidase [Bacillota bacterium]|nr:5'-methylthioadenosine/S-adenosylhomocysteine nucleosidase [Bacillota bacterium]
MQKLFQFKFYFMLIFLALFIVGCSDTTDEESSADTAEETEEVDTEEDATDDVPDNLIAIQGALDVEVSAALEQMDDYETEVHDNYTFYVGEIDGTPLVISRTEVGMVHAAASTATLIDTYDPELIINQGTAGGHNPDLDVFDIIIGTEVMNIGMYNTDHLGEGDGIKPKDWEMQPTRMREGDDMEMYDVFESDADLVETALGIADDYENGKVIEGKIGSADVWNREIDRINWFHEEHGTDGEEMEAAAVAQVAQNNDVPYLSVRIISNSEVSDDDTEDLETAGHYCMEFSIEIAKELN